MRKKRACIVSGSRFVLVLMVFLVSITACGGSSNEDVRLNDEELAWSNLKIHAPGDLISLAESISTNARFSATGIQDVQDGICPAAFSGKDLSSVDLTGLEDHVVAYDAVCILIDANSYYGGEHSSQNETGSVASGVKTEGMKEISQQDLISYLTFWTYPPGKRWEWDGQYYRYRQLFDPDTLEPLWEDYKAGIRRTGWVSERPPMYPSYNLVPGNFDMQTILYGKLGLNETELVDLSSAGGRQYTCPGCLTEQDVLVTYCPDRPPYRRGSTNFVFQLFYASRSISGQAKQNLPIEVMAVDGIDPLNNPGAIYDGSYLLSREIHLLTRQEASSEAEDLVDYLLSESGQKLLTDNGFLPLTQKVQ